MYVGGIMQTDLVTVAPDTSLIKAKKILEEKKIAHLLVVDKKDKLLGVVSDRDLKRSWASDATSLSVHELNYLLDKLTVETIMVKTFVSVSPATTIERAANIMQQNRVHALPIIQAGELVGIVTTTDVLGVLLQAIGIDRESSRFRVLVKDRIGVMAEVANLLKDAGINIRSLVTWPEKNYPGIYQLVMRVGAKDGKRAVQVLTKGGFKVLTRYVKDFQAYLPET